MRPRVGDLRLPKRLLGRHLAVESNTAKVRKGA